MKCHICGAEMFAIDTLESPVSGQIGATGYECPNYCEYIEWAKNQKDGDS